MSLPFKINFASYLQTMNHNQISIALSLPLSLVASESEVQNADVVGELCSSTTAERKSISES